MFAAILSAKHLRLYVIEDKGHVHVRIMFVGVGIRFDVSSQHGGIRGVERHLANTHREFGFVLRLIQLLFEFLQLVDLPDLRPVDDELGSVGLFHAQGGLVGTLAISERLRGVGIFPAIVVPVSDVLAEHDQLGARNGLVLVQFLQHDVGRRTARASFGSEELDENGDAGVRGIGGRRLSFRLRRLGGRD